MSKQTQNRTSEQSESNEEVMAAIGIISFNLHTTMAISWDVFNKGRATINAESTIILPTCAS